MPKIIALLYTLPSHLKWLSIVFSLIEATPILKQISSFRINHFSLVRVCVYIYISENHLFLYADNNNYHYYHLTSAPRTQTSNSMRLFMHTNLNLKIKKSPNKLWRVDVSLTKSSSNIPILCFNYKLKTPISNKDGNIDWV